MNNEQLIRERCRTVINRNENNLAIAQTTVELLKSFNEQLSFIARTGDQSETVDSPTHFKTHLLSNGKPRHGRPPISDEARERISKAQKTRWAASKAKNHRATNSRMPAWTEHEDNKILALLKTTGTITVGEAVNKVRHFLPKRTKGGIYQRIYHLQKKNQLKRETALKNQREVLLVGAA